jgi:hypothetical protein
MKEDTNKTWVAVHGGYAKDMTLRDHFAGLAMQIYMADQELIAVYSHLGKDAKREIAVTAYMMADAMLKARDAK